MKKVFLELTHKIAKVSVNLEGVIDSDNKVAKHEFEYSRKFKLESFLFQKKEWYIEHELTDYIFLNDEIESKAISENDKIVVKEKNKDKELAELQKKSKKYSSLLFMDKNSGINYPSLNLFIEKVKDQHLKFEGMYRWIINFTISNNEANSRLKNLFTSKDRCDDEYLNLLCADELEKKVQLFDCNDYFVENIKSLSLTKRINNGVLSKHSDYSLYGSFLLNSVKIYKEDHNNFLTPKRLLYRQTLAEFVERFPESRKQLVKLIGYENEDEAETYNNTETESHGDKQREIKIDSEISDIDVQHYEIKTFLLIDLSSGCEKLEYWEGIHIDDEQTRVLIFDISKRHLMIKILESYVKLNEERGKGLHCMVSKSLIAEEILKEELGEYDINPINIINREENIDTTVKRNNADIKNYFMKHKTYDIKIDLGKNTPNRKKIKEYILKSSGDMLSISSNIDEVKIKL